MGRKVPTEKVCSDGMAAAIVYERACISFYNR
jgi:hypothetical protein